MKFSFVILTWNRYKFLEECLSALVRSISDKDDCEIVVMNNGSTDKTTEVLDAYRNNKLFRITTRKKNYGLNSYKKLFNSAKGENIVIVDDDVLQFPSNIDTIFSDYLTTFSDYGFFALNVIQNEFTNGAKPPADLYTEETKNRKTMLWGPTGGWCTCFRKRDFRKIWLRFMLANFNMKLPEDQFLANQFYHRLKLKPGIIKDAVCLHAVGPYYAKMYGHINREVEKYNSSGLTGIAEAYQHYSGDKK